MSAQKKENSGAKKMKFSAIASKFIAYEVPRIFEKMSAGTGSKLVNYGVNNAFPQDMIDLYNESSTHRSIIDSKVTYIVGQDLYADSIEASKWLEKANRFESWKNIYKKIVRDCELYDGYCIEVRQARKGAARQYFYMDFSRIRKNEDGEYLYSEEWSTRNAKNANTANSRAKKTKIPAFNKDKFQKRSLIYHQVSRPGGKYYPLPNYIASLAEIKTDVQIGNFWLSEIMNNYAMGGTIIFSEGSPETEDDKREIEDLLDEKFGGSSNANKWTALFADDADSKPEIVVHDGNNMAERYNATSERVKEALFIGHRITNPILFGVTTPGAMGQRNELATAYELFNKTYVVDRRDITLTTLRRLCFIDTNRSDIEIETLAPVSDEFAFSESVISSVLSREELRDLISRQLNYKLEDVSQTMRSEQFLSMSDEFILDKLSKCGKTSKNVKILKKMFIEHDEDGEPMRFDTHVSELEERILLLIRENPKITRSEMSKALDVDLDEIALIIDNLQSKNLVAFTGIMLSLTSVGRELPIDETLPEVKLMYRYVTREDAPALKPGGKSREFCRRMLAMDKLWTRSEIDLLRNQMQESDIADVRDVWMSRGGWYRRPGQEVSVPFCRHIWEQVLVVEEE